MKPSSLLSLLTVFTSFVSAGPPEVLWEGDHNCGWAVVHEKCVHAPEKFEKFSALQSYPSVDKTEISEEEKKPQLMFGTDGYVFLKADTGQVLESNFHSAQEEAYRSVFTNGVIDCVAVIAHDASAGIMFAGHIDKLTTNNDGEWGFKQYIVDTLFEKYFKDKSAVKISLLTAMATDDALKVHDVLHEAGYNIFASYVLPRQHESSEDYKSSIYYVDKGVPEAIGSLGKVLSLDITVDVATGAIDYRVD